MFNKKTKRIKELEEVLEGMKTERDFLCDRLRGVVELEESNFKLCTERNYWSKRCNEDENKALELEDKVKDLEKELGRCRADKEFWHNQFELVSGKFQAYEAIANKFMAVHEDGDVDDTHIIHNGKVYTIVGIKHIVDNLGDTLDIRAELIDPEKAEEKKIGFKLEEKEPVIKEDDE